MASTDVEKGRNEGVKMKKRTTKKTDVLPNKPGWRRARVTDARVMQLMSSWSIFQPALTGKRLLEELGLPLTPRQAQRYLKKAREHVTPFKIPSAREAT